MLVAVQRPRFVETVRSASAPARGRTRRVDRLPDGRTALVLRVLETGRGDLHVVGPCTHAHLKDAQGFERAMSFALAPGSSMMLFGVPAHELTDRYTMLEDVWGGPATDLLAALLDTASVPEATALVAEALARRVSETFEPVSAHLARRAARLLEDGASVRVESVADRLGVTARHLRRAFAEHIGVAPKEFARSARLQRALRLTTHARDWSRIAAEAGYYDQAHLIADFHDLVGLTPVAYSKRASEQDPPA
ncbi:MAG: Transcriptional regulator, AraC family protein [Labilithrix sp.]|nr:Transcriptional regulator, AraC family protein [Labilithrix sp.]